MLKITVLYLSNPSLSKKKTLSSSISLKIDRSNTLIGIGASVVQHSVFL